MFLLMLISEFWDIEQSSILYLWLITFSYVPVKGRIGKPYEIGLFDRSGKVVFLPVKMLKSFTDVLWPVFDCGLLGEGALKCSLNLSP